MIRTAPFALGALVTLVAGCPDDPIPAAEASSGDASSTGPGSSSSGDDDPSATSLDDTAGTTTTSGGETDTDATTTGSTASGHARFVVREPIADADGFVELTLRRYVDGELLPPVSLTPTLPAGGGATFARATDGGQKLTYCIFDPAATGRPCFVVDATVDPPSAPQPFATGPVPPTALFDDFTWIDATQSFAFRAIDAADLGSVAIYTAGFRGGMLATPQVVAAPEAGASLAPYSFAPDGTRVGYSSGPTAGPRNAFVAPLDMPSPGSAVVVSDLVPPATTASAPEFLPGLDAVIYSTDDDMPGPDEDALYFVDTSGAMPGAPIRIDDPQDEALGIRRVQVAPDGHALLYWVGTDLLGDLMLVDFSAGVPQPPVRVSSLGDGQTFVADYGWSPDSQRIMYRAEHDQPDTYDLYVVDASADPLGPPVLATGGVVPGGDIALQLFDAQSHWLYYIAAQDRMRLELYRVDVSGPEPGPPQRVSGPLSRNGSLPGELIPSHDWSTILYTAEDGEPRGRDLYLVDVTGPEPGEAQRINAPLPADTDVRFGARFSLDDTVVLYARSGPSPDDPVPLHLVDLTDGSVRTVVDDVDGFEPVVD